MSLSQAYPSYNTFSQNAAVLSRLSEMTQLSGSKAGSKEKFKVVLRGHAYSIVTIPKYNGLVRFLRFLVRKPVKTTENLCRLKGFFDSVVLDITQDPSKKERYAPLVASAFDGLKQLFEVYLKDKSSAGTLKCNDILEALSVVYRKKNSLNELLGLNIQRIPEPSTTMATPSFRHTSIPLVRFSDMTRAIQLLEAAKNTTSGLTLNQVQQQLQGLLLEENVPMGRLIDAMYRHDLHIHSINKLLTWVMGKKNRSKNVTALSIVKFLKRLNVIPYIALNQQLYAYSEVYKTELRKEPSNDAAFLRSFKDEISEEFFLKQARERQEEIYKTCGEGNLIISNSFNRLRLHYITKNDQALTSGHPKKGVHAKFNITGKMMSNSAQNRHAAKHEKSYTGKFAFSIKNMLGSEDNRSTAIDKPHLVVPESSLDAITANRKLLDCMTNMIDRHDMTMIVQRLAPEDVHHFAFPVKGRLISKEECCKTLIEMLKKTAQSNDYERVQLTELLHLFSKESDAEKANGTVNIQGTQCSVNPKALNQHSEILAQNDRRITMVRHEDDSVSIHAYVGATGVNSVDVTGKAGAENTAGVNVGSMGFGNISGKKLWQKGQAKVLDAGTSRAVRCKSKTHINRDAGKKGGLGESLGNFPKEGSTVVSLYFSKDMVPVDELHRFTHTVRYKVTRNLLLTRIRNCFCVLIGKHFGMKKLSSFKVSRAIEVKASLGDVIGLPKIYVAVKAVIDTISNKVFDDLIGRNYHSSDMILQTIQETFLKTFDPNKSCITQQDEIGKAIWNAWKKAPQSRTEDDIDLLDKLHRGMMFRTCSKFSIG